MEALLSATSCSICPFICSICPQSGLNLPLLPDTRMGEPQGILLRLRRVYPHTKPPPRGRRTREAGDSRGPGADEPPVRDHSTRIYWHKSTHHVTKTRTSSSTATPQPDQHRAQEAGQGLRDASLGTPRNHPPPTHVLTGSEIKVQGVPVPRVSEVRARRARHRVAGQEEGP